MKLRSLLFLLVALPAMVWAQTTTSTLGGTVKTAGGEPLIGATITATFEPTGTVYRTQSRTAGRYEIANMAPGGPYTLTISFINYETFKKEEVYLNLGESSRQDFKLGDKSAQLTEVTVLANRAQAQGKGGAETNIGRDKIANLPSVGRNISDYVRFTPQAKLTAADGGISIAGQNNRYNGFYIDGAVNNDVFGLSNSGTNGGQTGAPPISIDAIDQFQVIVSPFDASIGNFTGGGINATTRSGTNTLTGSVYSFFRSENLAGKTPGNIAKENRRELADFTAKTNGFRIGGPLIKNKLFFFLNAEIQREQRPQPFTLSQYNGNTRNIDSINLVRNFVKTTYGYETGSFLDNPDKLKGERVATKIDWNISDKHRLTASYRYNKAVRDNTFASSTNAINFLNNGYIFPNTTHSASLELKSNLGKGMSNKLLLTYKSVSDDIDPIGAAFPRVTIFDGAGRFVLGTENFSTGNFLQQDNIALLDFFKFNKGKHYFTVGTDNEFSKSNNVFVRDNYGTYEFANVNAFLTGAKPTRFQRTFSLVDNIAGDATNAAAKFNSIRLGGFINDEFKVTDNLTLNFGLRLDYTKFLTKPRTDQFFNDTALPILSQFYDMKGARSGQIAEPKASLSPRIGIAYKIPEEELTIRGGIGLFTGRIPLVWPGGVYNNNGVTLGGVDVSGVNTPVFNPNPNAQPTAADFGLSLANAKGQVDLIAKDFRLPKLLRTSLGVDKKLGNGWTTSIEGIFSKNMNEIWYENVYLRPSTLMSEGPGSRKIFNPAGPASFIPVRSGSTVNPYSTGVFLLSNNKNAKGFSYNFTFTVDKAWKNGFAFNANYGYGNSVVTNEGTSSQNNSQWRFMETVNGRNTVGRSTSDFNLGHRINAYIAKKFTYANNHLATTISLVYNGQSGNPYSFVYSQSMVGDNGRGENNDLIYVPTASEISSGAIQLIQDVNGGYPLSGADQAAALNAYIDADKHLSKRRGQFAERNGARLPMTHILDLKIQQDFTVKVGSKRYSLQLSYDVFNFTNMINRDWGKQYFLGNDSYQLIRFRGYQSIVPGATGYLVPQYSFRAQINTPYGISTSTIPSYAARWISQLGLRLNF